MVTSMETENTIPMATEKQWKNLICTVPILNLSLISNTVPFNAISVEKQIIPEEKWW